MARRPTRTKTPVQAVSFPHVPVEHDWTTVFEARVLGKTLTRGTQFMVRGERGGRFSFVSHTRTADGREWVTAVGGTSGVRMTRAFRPERISRILRIKLP